MRGKSLHWYLNAPRRTLLALLPRLARPDDEWAKARLPRVERALFLSLPPQERHHGVQVAKRLLERLPGASGVLIRAALLHDVGKLGSPQAATFRVLAHLLPRAALPPEPRFRGLKGALQARQHHAAYGARLILEAGGCKRVAELVERHHDAGAGGDLAALRLADELT